MKSVIRYVECPRDSWQGFSRTIPTSEKRRYLQALLGAGFKYLDLGSFVSPKAVPQLADTEKVLQGLARPDGVDFLGIIANEKGLQRALAIKNVSSVGYPLSVNETFQQRNTRRSLAESWLLTEQIFQEASAQARGFVVYLSMGFGNPYGEAWQAGDTARAVTRLRDMGVRDIALADTVGTATPERLAEVLDAVGEVEGLGLHLHARPDGWQDQLELALDYGLTWFEGALGGIGGCPFAGDDLVGNLPTESVLPFLKERGLDSGVDKEMLPQLSQQATELKSFYV